jgi:hypothetical protein
MLGGPKCVIWHVWEKLSEGDTDYKRKYESFRQKNANSAVPFKVMKGKYCGIFGLNIFT